MDSARKDNNESPGGETKKEGDDDDGKPKSAPEMLSSDMLFPWKLHELLTDLEKDDRQHIVSWVSGGRAFKIHKRVEFSKLLPLYFNHTNVKSFQRQASNPPFKKSFLANCYHNVILTFQTLRPSSHLFFSRPPTISSHCMVFPEINLLEKQRELIITNTLFEETVSSAV
jgi:hypothetical protein